MSCVDSERGGSAPTEFIVPLTSLMVPEMQEKRRAGTLLFGKRVDSGVRDRCPMLVSREFVEEKGRKKVFFNPGLFSFDFIVHRAGICRRPR